MRHLVFITSQGNFSGLLIQSEAIRAPHVTPNLIIHIEVYFTESTGPLCHFFDGRVYASRQIEYALLAEIFI